jgi:hypothetical protein
MAMYIFCIAASLAMLDQKAYTVIIKLGKQRIIVYTSMDKARADLVHDAIAWNVQARTMAGQRQPSTV